MKYIIPLILLSIFSHALDVTVSILPQKYFVEQIAKDKVNVNVMVQPGFSPATYSPKTSQMRELSKSKIYFSIDVPFEEAWLDKFKNSNKSMLLVDTAEGIEKLEMQEHTHHEENNEENEHEEDAHEKHETHDEEHEKHETHSNHKEHEHEGLDPHIWVDPLLVKIQAKNILDALIKIDTINKDFYIKNYNLFVKELDILDSSIKKILKNSKNEAFMVFHPSWNYFAKAYNLEQIAVEKEGKEPKIKELIKLIEEAKEHKIKIVFVSTQFSQNAAKKIASSINAKVVNIDHLAYNWKDNLLKVANEIKNSTNE